MKRCKICKKPFKAKTKEQVYCNGNCASKDKAWILKTSCNTDATGTDITGFSGGEWVPKIQDDSPA